MLTGMKSSSHLLTLTKRLTKNIKCITPQVFCIMWDWLLGFHKTCSAIGLLIRLCQRGTILSCKKPEIRLPSGEQRQGIEKLKWEQACLVTTLAPRSFLTCCYKRRHTFFPYFLSPLQRAMPNRLQLLLYTCWFTPTSWRSKSSDAYLLKQDGN